jgi:hypothetical protein
MLCGGESADDDSNMRLIVALAIIRHNRRAALAPDAPGALRPAAVAVDAQQHQKLGKQLEESEAERRYLHQRIAHLEPDTCGLMRPLSALPSNASMLAWLQASTADRSPSDVVLSGLALLETLMRGADEDRGRPEVSLEVSTTRVLARILSAQRMCTDAEGDGCHILGRLASLLLHPLSAEDRMLPAGWALAAQRLLELVGGEPSLADATCTALAQHLHGVVRRLVTLFQPQQSHADANNRAEALALNSAAVFGALLHALEQAAAASCEEGWFVSPDSAWRGILNAAFELSCEAGLVRCTPLVTMQLWHTCLTASGPTPASAVAPAGACRVGRARSGEPPHASCASHERQLAPDRLVGSYRNLAR